MNKEKLDEVINKLLDSEDRTFPIMLGLLKVAESIEKLAEAIKIE